MRWPFKPTVIVDRIQHPVPVNCGGKKLEASGVAKLAP
jgi:hypothetical protein